MTHEVPIDTRTQTVKQLRRARRSRMLRRLGLGVGLPTLTAAIYYGLVATPQYESLSSFTIQSADGNSRPSLELLIAAVPGNSAGRDVRLVQEYIHSRDMLALLRDEHSFLSHYTQEDIDFASRLEGHADLEQQFEFFESFVTVEHDDPSGVLTLRVRAFDSESAERFNQAILDASEGMVNAMTERARSDRMGVARREVETAEERLREARQELVALQRERAEFDPRSTAEALLSVRSGLETELASARAELSTRRATLQPNAPQLLEQRRRVAALAAQVARQDERLAGDNRDGLHETLARFEPAVAEKEFAQRAYESALASLEMARVDADRQHRYLVTIASPSRPDAPTHPDPLRAILTVFILSFALMGIGTLLLASLREHANV